MINVILPILSSALSLVCAVFVFRRFTQRKGIHLLLWGIGILMYGIGGASEAYHGAFGWSSAVFRRKHSLEPMDWIFSSPRGSLPIFRSETPEPSG